jgi:hypothetical protein
MEVLRDILSIPKTIYKEVRSGHTQRSYSHSRRRPEGRSYRDDGYGYVEPESRSRSRTSRVDSGYGSGSRGRRRQVSDPELSTKRTKDYRNGYGSIEREREERAAAGELDEEEVIRVERRDREDRKRYRESVELGAEQKLRRAREDASGSRQDNERRSTPHAEAIHLAEMVRKFGEPPKVYVTEQTTSSNHPTTRDYSSRRDSRPPDRPRTKMLDHQFWSNLGPRGRERAANRCRDDLNEAYPEFTGACISDLSGRSREAADCQTYSRVWSPWRSTQHSGSSLAQRKAITAECDCTGATSLMAGPNGNKPVETRKTELVEWANG